MDFKKHLNRPELTNIIHEMATSKRRYNPSINDIFQSDWYEMVKGKLKNDNISIVFIDAQCKYKKEILKVLI